jgi:hypothetical protein
MREGEEQAANRIHAMMRSKVLKFTVVVFSVSGHKDEKKSASLEQVDANCVSKYAKIPAT